jgi:hypothetical protein
MDARRFAGIALVSLLCVPPAHAGDALPTRLPAHGFVPRGRDDRLKLPPRGAAQLRNDALARARIWREPNPPVQKADLGHNPRGPGSFDASDPVVCKFQPRETGGRTPKFYCVFEGGDVLKVKYGRNPEIHTEVAATRLLDALGAGADRMYLVRKLRCFGCPENPQAMLSCISSPSETVRRNCGPLYGAITPTGGFAVQVNYAGYVDFGPVAIERPLEGKEIRTDSVEGWGWDELDRQQSEGGRASRAERDALRLVAVLLNNWDNRPDNQSLLCLPGGGEGDGRCRRPFAYMADVGATFGRVGAERKEQRKLDLDAWRDAPIWEDRETCRVRIVSPPLHGATFGTAVISESGRRFLAARLGRLTKRQIRDLFESAGFASFEEASAGSRDVEGWVKVFGDKVRQITGGKPCPTA